MNEPKIYWYNAIIYYGRRGNDSQKVLFKSDKLYEYGDRITKRYESGLVVSLVIKYPYCTTFPAHEFKRLQDASVWPPIISEI